MGASERWMGDNQDTKSVRSETSSVQRLNFGSTTRKSPTRKDEYGNTPEMWAAATRGATIKAKQTPSRPSTSDAPFQGMSKATVPLSSFLGGPPPVGRKPMM